MSSLIQPPSYNHLHNDTKFGIPNYAIYIIRLLLHPCNVEEFFWVLPSHLNYWVPNTRQLFI